MSSFTPAGVKRQKVREPRPCDNVDYFQGIDKVEFNNMAAPSDSSSYRYYSAAERVHARSMEDWLKFSVSLTDFKHGSEYHGKQSNKRPWDDGSTSQENYKRCVKAFFDFCQRLGIRYWTAFDSDLVLMAEGWEDNKQQWDDMVEYVQELSQRSHVKLLWIAPDLHTNSRYSSGAMTSNEATTFAQAATQIRRCLEVAQRLNAECFMLWPHREGYENIFLTDVNKEIKLFTKLLKLTAEHKERLNFRCQLIIMPYHGGSWYSPGYTAQRGRDEVVNKYMWDVTSCLYFLKNSNLERNFKVCSPPGHHVFMASVYNMLGGVIISNEVDQYDTKTFTLLMKSIIEQGTASPGGICLKLRLRRVSTVNELKELVIHHVKYIDAIAKGLRFAASVVTDQTLSKYLQQKYVTYYSGFGARLAGSDVTMEECEDYCKKNMNNHVENPANKSEHMDLVFQRFLDTSENF